jgi:hypothetical protein
MRAAISIGWGVKLDGERMAVGAGRRRTDPTGVATPGSAADDDPEYRGAAVRLGRRVVRLRTGPAAPHTPRQDVPVQMQSLPRGRRG